MPMPHQLLTLADLPIDRPMPKISRQRVIGEHMMVSAVVLEEGFALESHHHANEQFVIVQRGRCIFGVGTPGTPEHREVEVSTGQVLVLPPNLPHSCRALEQTHILDLFSPPSATTGVDKR
ncbi:MAG: cupin domain-containing protein [Tepidisphaera sp.]